VEIFHSGQLFTQEAEQLAVRRGTVDMVYSGPSWLGEHVPYVSMFTMAYLFRDYEHMTAVLNGPIGKRVFEDVAQKVGVRPLGAFYLGTRELNLRDIGRIVQHPQDLSGIKLRMPNSMCWLFLGEALGASPANISFTELYMALKSGTVDGHDNPLPTSKNARLYEVTSQIVLTDHYVHPAWPSINEDVWQRMDQDLQEKMYDAIDKARERCDTINLRAETELLTFFQSQGITITIPDRQQFAGHAREKYFKDHPLVQFWDMELYEQVLETGK
jgi:TRAP-type C4-dicarboxylate transport system substrate-binding protein